MTVGSPPTLDHEFVSDTFQPGDINADDLKKEMDQLGVSEAMKVIDGKKMCFHFHNLLSVLLYLVQSRHSHQCFTSSEIYKLVLLLNVQWCHQISFLYSSYCDTSRLFIRWFTSCVLGKEKTARSGELQACFIKTVPNPYR